MSVSIDSEGNSGNLDPLIQWVRQQQDRQVKRQRVRRLALHVTNAALVYLIVLASISALTKGAWWAVAVQALLTTAFALSTLHAELRRRRDNR